MKELIAEGILYLAILCPFWDVFPEELIWCYHQVWRLDRLRAFAEYFKLSSKSDWKYDFWHCYRLWYYRSRSLYK